MDKKYTITFEQRVHNLAGGRTLRRYLELPFRPSVGLEVSHGDWSCLVAKIWYQADTDEFCCFAEPDCQTYNPQAHETFEEIVDGYLADGWE